MALARPVTGPLGGSMLGQVTSAGAAFVSGEAVSLGSGDGLSLASGDGLGQGSADSSGEGDSVTSGEGDSDGSAESDSLGSGEGDSQAWTGELGDRTEWLADVTRWTTGEEGAVVATSAAKPKPSRMRGRNLILR